MRVPRVPPLVIPKAPKVPTWDEPVHVSTELEPQLESFAETVIRAALHLAERTHAQMLVAPARAIAAQTNYLHVDAVESY